jgi:hypothetical protein
LKIGDSIVEIFKMNNSYEDIKVQISSAMYSVCS